MGSLSVWHWLLFLAVALLVFGGSGKISSIMGDVAKGINRLAVELHGLTGGATYTVELNGAVIGTFTTDKHGHGHLFLKDLSTPPTAGAVLTIVDASGATVLTGTFAASGGH